ncbi:MAG: hypothetical protein ABI041_14405 [Bdellovibrionia bacterium]
MTKLFSILIILSDHNQRVSFREMAERTFGISVFSAGSAFQGLDLLKRIKSPEFILLSSQPFPLMTYEQFLSHKSRDPSIAGIPVVLLSTALIKPMPAGIDQQVADLLSKEDLAALIKRYNSSTKN